MKALLASALLSITLAACGPLLPRSPTPELHDLGSQRTARPLARVPVLTDVRAPNWLDGTAIHYRLAYESETRRRSYALSRWAAPPAELLSVALRRMLDSPGAPSTCRLVVELDTAGRLHRTEFARDWVRIAPQAGRGALLEVCAGNRSVKVGRFLRAELRPALAREIRQALRNP